MSGIVVIRRCASSEEAAIVCALLNDADIPSSLENWYHATIDWGALQAFGGVGVQVPANQIEAARQAIIEYADSADQRLSESFPNLDSAPLQTKKLRQIVLISCYTFILPTTLILLAFELAGRLKQTPTASEANWRNILTGPGVVDWCLYALSSALSLAAYVVFVSVFVLLSKRFLARQAKPKGTP